MSPIRSAQPLSASVEDYLKCIYELGASGAAAGTNEIADVLKIAPASVSGMLPRLVEQKLVAHERYRGVRLTATGRRAALKTIRRHRVIEAYLADALGMPWDLVHEEAERLEHAASDELVDRMAAALGEPETDPHGAPIPTRDGHLEERPLSSLADLRPGERAAVARVSDEDGARLRYLDSLGITPGAPVRVLERAPYAGPLTVRVGKKARVIGVELAKEIYVTR